MPNKFNISAAEIAAKLLLNGRNGRWRGSCPVCLYPDALSLTETTKWPLIYCANGCSQQTLRDILNEASGFDFTAQKLARGPRITPANIDERIAGALKIWNASTPAIGTPADTYLTERGLRKLAESDALRFCWHCGHPCDRTATYPALVAQALDVNGQPTAVHRTYLTRNGQKAQLNPPKASKGVTAGSAIRLDPVAFEIVVGEGIETSASAGRLLRLPAWAAISAGNLGRTLILPPEVGSVVVAADADEPGEKAAQAAAARWQAEGRRVRIARPKANGQDFNDVLLARREVPDAI